MSRVRMPGLVLIFVMIDFALGLSYVLDYMTGQRYRKLTSLLDLNGEDSVPTWFSSIQWFCVAALLGIFTHRNFNPSKRISWLLTGLPLVFLLFSVDEFAQIHEWLGYKSDMLLPGDDRGNTFFRRTGIWMVVIGVPFVVLFAMLIVSIREYFRRAPGALVKVLLGITVMLIGSTVIEVLSNVADPGSGYGVLQIVFEEMFEMLGATIVFWGSYELLYRHGFSFNLDKAGIDQAAFHKANSF